MKSKEFSKDCFYNALISLLDEEEFSNIQISEICHKAGFNRSTFYRNYKSKIDIIIDKFNSEAIKCRKAIDSSSDHSLLNRITILFEMLKENSKVFILMHEASLDFQMFLVYKNIYKYENFSKSYEFDYFAAGSYGVIMDWVLSGMKETAKQMAKIITNLIKL